MNSKQTHEATIAADGPPFIVGIGRAWEVVLRVGLKCEIDRGHGLERHDTETTRTLTTFALSAEEASAFARSCVSSRAETTWTRTESVRLLADEHRVVVPKAWTREESRP